ncbi:MAG: hypothetical protein COA50_07665 [Flavobacteriaceae bacterium]|nr:MAG: hypothetical protein COA50_07665 [Flavobacteriaceae bacterium]
MLGNDFKGRDASYVSRLNKIEVLKLIRESEQISRADIVKRMGLSAPTVTRIVEGLIGDKLVVMTGKGDSTGGRRPKLLRFDGTNDYVIGIDLGSTSIRAAISDLEGNFITEIEMPTDLESGFEKVCLQVAQVIGKLINRFKLDEGKILGVGLAVAGLIKFENGLIEYSPVFDWRNVNLRTELSRHIALPIFYDNVTRVTALGELVHGVGKEHRNFICVNAGYGIGAGIIINGAPFYGSHGFSGEFGHLIVDNKNEYIGKGGLRGSLESLASGYGIAETAKRRVSVHESSKILDKVKGKLEEITAKTVVDCAKEKDSLAIEIFNEAMDYWGIGLDALIKLFDPEVIVISGGLINSGEIFFERLRENILKNDFKQVKNEVQILPSSFGDDATLTGALSLVISKVLQFETKF